MSLPATAATAASTPSPPASRSSRSSRAGRAAHSARAGRSGRLLPWRWSLRTRLIAVLMILLAAVSLVIVLVTTFVLRGYLVGQVDGRLQAADKRSAAPPPRPWVPLGYERPPDIAPEFLFALGNAEGTLGAEVAGGEGVKAAVIGTTGTLRQLPAEVAEVLARVPADREPHTVQLGDLGDYRLLAARAQDGTTRVTGLPLDDANATFVRLTVVVVGVAAVGTVAAGVIGAMTVRRTLRPLRRVAATASRVTELPLDRGEVALPVRIPGGETDPRTEVGQVSIALERLLGHVDAALSARHASETRVRQFVADASHELRTPLAAISGYAELTRRIHDRVPEDVAYAMRRVESESARMTALVEDLLLLARLDAGRPLAHEPVDLSRLVVDAASDAHVASPGHRWELALPDEPVTVVGDAARLHQVLANLLANARTHTPPGTRVTASLAVADAAMTGHGHPEAVVYVIDNGPGIPPELLPNVFERFARGDTSRSRAAGSTGLGLAIVAAVVEAHHGRVEVTSAPGRTAFCVRLPLAALAEPPVAPVPPVPPESTAAAPAQPSVGPTAVTTW